MGDETMTKANDVARVVGDEDIDHVLLHYASSVKNLIKRNKDGSFRKRNGATRVFVSILGVVSEKTRQWMLDELEDYEPEPAPLDTRRRAGL